MNKANYFHSFYRIICFFATKIKNDSFLQY